MRNVGDRPALLIDGEHLEGAKQNRVLNVTVLVAARRDTVVPVSCVEQGRWSYGADQGFAPSPEVAHSLLRGGTAQSHMERRTLYIEPMEEPATAPVEDPSPDPEPSDPVPETDPQPTR
jgi:hypothetical protein